MRKTLRKKKTLSCLAALLMLGGCASIDVRQDFDFTVFTLPYAGTLSEGTPAEIRFEIRPGEAGSLSDSTRYYVRYFPSSGQGTLRVGQDTALRPNDPYRLTNRTFRMYYLPAWGTAETEHALDLTFFDSWRHEVPVTLQFNKKAENEIENEIVL